MSNFFKKQFLIKKLKISNFKILSKNNFTKKAQIILLKNIDNAQKDQISLKRISLKKSKFYLKIQKYQNFLKIS
jgi:hypothetical protein